MVVVMVVVGVVVVSDGAHLRVNVKKLLENGGY